MGSLNKTFIKRSGLFEKKIGGDIVIYDEEEGEVLRLNEAGSEIWNNLCPDKSIGDIINEVSSVFTRQAKLVENDVLGFIKQLERLSLIENYSPELVKERLNEIYQKIPPTVCRKCGRCCSNTIISSVEFENISGYVETEFSPDFKKYFRAGFTLNIATQVKQREYMYKENIEEMPPLEVCVFLDQSTKECLIYPKRPFACRIFGLEDKSRCPQDSVRAEYKEEARLSKEKIDALNNEVISFSPYYWLLSGKEAFNRAEINLWFYHKHKGQLLPVRQQEEAPK